jgi:hypothetical protein
MTTTSWHDVRLGGVRGLGLAELLLWRWFGPVWNAMNSTFARVLFLPYVTVITHSTTGHEVHQAFMGHP